MNSSTIEFFVKMKDMMSIGLAKIGKNTQDLSSTVKTLALSVQNNLGKAYESVASSVNRYTASLKNALSAQSRLSSSAGGKTGGGGGSGGGGGIFGLTGLITHPAALAAMAAVAAIGKGLHTALGGGMQAEKDKVGLTTFLGKQGAETAYANIRKDAAATPYDTASLLMVNRSLISAGVSAENARRDTMNLANAISAVGGGNDELSRMAANMQQIKTVGKATAMDIRQFGMTGINIYEMLSRSTGKSIDQVKEMDVSYGTLSAALAQAAGKGGMYFGALDTMSKTTEGRWSTLKDTVANSFADFGLKLLPFVNKGLDIANSILEKITGWVSGISVDTKGWSGYIDTFKAAFVPYLGMIKSAASFVWSIASGIIDWVKNSELLKDVFGIIGWVVQKVYRAITFVIDGLKWAWENIIKPILDAINTVYTAIKYPLGGGLKVTHKSSDATALTLNSDNLLSDILKPKPKGKDNVNDLDVAKGITSGGPRVINISGVKFTDKIEIHTSTVGEAIDDLEDKFRMMFARLLNSGAAVQ